MKHFKIFGSICYVHVPDSRRSKLDPKVRKCMFIGYDERKKGWKCMDPETHKFTVSRDVVFDEILSFYDVKGGDEEKISLPMFPPNISHSPVMPYEERGAFASTRKGRSNRILKKFSTLQDSKPRRNFVKPARCRDENFISTYSCFIAGPVDDDDELFCYEEAKVTKFGKIPWMKK
ncbi:UNVERIFIED_CONTAM: hypothetical protein Slati_0447100 [Sesamum latifolium]|uniref:Retroviral polymerase SH3-like domain-containing protein n=1 Tax=Sesamum latifolium TaxID=2727402 RepID=A0AAW2XW36_9LAMI